MSDPAGRPLRLVLLVLVLGAAPAAGAAEAPAPKFRACAFHTVGVEEAHLSFVREANRWFTEAAREDGFSYEATADWTRLEPEGGASRRRASRARPRTS